MFARLKYATLAAVVVAAVPFCGANAAAITPTAIVTIDDLTNTLIGTATGVTNLTIGVTMETVGGLGGADFHFEYVSIDPTAPAPGATRVTNYNISEPGGAGGPLSDTLNITITGHTPVTGDLSNVSIDMHFRSDSADEVVHPPALADGLSIVETGVFQTVASGLSDLSVSFRSDLNVPEPGTLAIIGLGLAGLGFMRRKRAA